MRHFTLLYIYYNSQFTEHFHSCADFTELYLIMSFSVSVNILLALPASEFCPNKQIWKNLHLILDMSLCLMGSLIFDRLYKTNKLKPAVEKPDNTKNWAYLEETMNHGK